MVRGQQVRPPPSKVLAALGLSDSALHALSAALQGMVSDGVSASVPSPDPPAPTGKVATLYLLRLRFAYRVAADWELPRIWDAVSQEKGRMEGLSTLNQALMRGL